MLDKVTQLQLSVELLQQRLKIVEADNEVLRDDVNRVERLLDDVLNYNQSLDDPRGSCS